MSAVPLPNSSVDFAAATAQEPKWISAPMADLLNDLARQKELLHLSTRGIATLQSAPIVAEAGARVRREALTEERKRYEEGVAELARRELADGFQLLYSQAVIAMWHSLENGIRRIVVAWLSNDPSALQVDAVRKLRIRVGDYHSLSEDDRMYLIADQLDQELGAPLKLGIGRFDALLDPFGFSGPVDESVRKTVFELQQIRNVLVHRGGRADRHLLEKCPWLDCQTNDQIRITNQTYERYLAAVFVYVISIVTRIEIRFNCNTDWSRRLADEEIVVLHRLSKRDGNSRPVE